jgi:heme/copper-type cytochrome/quinol oxidase subunit 1
VMIYNIFYSLRKGETAHDNPWDAWTLEWLTSSPPPPQNFQWLPLVRSRRPLWDLNHPEDPDWKRK